MLEGGFNGTGVIAAGAGGIGVGVEAVGFGAGGVAEGNGEGTTGTELVDFFTVSGIGAAGVVDDAAGTEPVGGLDADDPVP